MNYGYILTEDITKHKFPCFRATKINHKEVYKTPENTLEFYYLPYAKAKSREEKNIKSLTDILKKSNTKNIAFSPDSVKFIPFLQDKGFHITDGRQIQKHLLVQAVFSYLKSNIIDIEKTGIHICADTATDIEFFFNKLGKLNTVFSMGTHNEKFYKKILNKYGIAVHFSDNINNEIIICHSNKIPNYTNSHLIDLSTGNYHISCRQFPDIFPKITPIEAELLLKINHSSLDSGYSHSCIEITYF